MLERQIVSNVTQNRLPLIAQYGARRVRLQDRARIVVNDRVDFHISVSSEEFAEVNGNSLEF